MASREKEALTRRNAREACWSARDAFMACLDKHKSIPIKPDGSDCPAECEPLRGPFTQQCMSSWVSSLRVRTAILIKVAQVKYFLEQRLNKKQLDMQMKHEDLRF